MVPPRRPPKLLVPRDATATERQGQGIGDTEAMRQMATRAIPEMLSMTPGIGELMSLYEAGKAASEGDKLGTGLALAGAIPIAGTIGRVTGKAGKLGREIFERSRLIGRPINFPEEKAALGRVLRAEAEKPLPPAMQNRPIIEGEHSTPYLFEAPSISRSTAGTGAGDFWQGPGFYKSTSVGPNSSVSSSYRESTAFVPQFVRMPSGTTIDIDAVGRQGKKLRFDDPRQETITSLLETAQTHYNTTPQEALNALARYRQDAVDAYNDMRKSTGAQKAEDREAFRAFMHSVGDARRFFDASGNFRSRELVPQDLREATYATQFAANPDELFDLQRFASDQPASERILAVLRGMSNPVRPSESLADAAARMQRAGMPAFEINERLVGNKYRDAADMFSGLDRFELMNELNARGIVGNQYLTKFAAENPNLPRTYNYVVQDPSRVRLTDVWAAAPLGLALQRAEQERPAADSTTRSKKR